MIRTGIDGKRRGRCAGPCGGCGDLSSNKCAGGRVAADLSNTGRVVGRSHREAERSQAPPRRERRLGARRLRDLTLGEGRWVGRGEGAEGCEGLEKGWKWPNAGGRGLGRGGARGDWGWVCRDVHRRRRAGGLGGEGGRWVSLTRGRSGVGGGWGLKWWLRVDSQATEERFPGGEGETSSADGGGCASVAETLRSAYGGRWGEARRV
jgi:hypothetical protein